MYFCSDASSEASRIHRAWKDAWLSFRAVIWTQVEEPGWCWLSQALQMYKGEESDVIRALRSEFEDLSWWKEWRAWNEQYERLLPTVDDLRSAGRFHPLPSELPAPPDEPEGIWRRAEELWRSNNRLLAIGGGTIRTVFARGRATRTVRGS